MTTGEILKSLRKDRGITQKRLAEMTGLATITIQGYEAGKYKPKLEQLQRIANALEIPLTDLIDQNVQNLTDDILSLFAHSNIQDLGSIDPSTANEHFLIIKFRELNDNGQKRATDYIEDLSKIPEYQKEKK